MDLLKESDFRKEIKAEPRLGYVFFGEEDYLKSFAIRAAEEALCPDPAFSIFNVLRLDGLDLTPQTLLDALTPLPMMSDRKLILITGFHFQGLRPEEVDAFFETLEQLPEFDYNTLILNLASSFDSGNLPKKPSALLQRLSEHLTPVWFEKVTGVKLAAWVQRHFLHRGIEAPAAFCSRMTEYCGHSMLTLSSEIDKLSFYLLAHGKTVPDEESMIRVCTSANEYDAFAFTNAIMSGNADRALAILEDYRFRRVDPLFILGEVTRVISEMLVVQSMFAEGSPTAEISSAFKPPLHEYRIGLYRQALRQTDEKRMRRALDACVAADAALKFSLGSKDYSPLERLICTI